MDVPGAPTGAAKRIELVGRGLDGLESLQAVFIGVRDTDALDMRVQRCRVGIVGMGVSNGVRAHFPIFRS